ncbi:MAG: Fe-S oxidoreductase [Rhodospirillaceae bacterium]|nr:Fe-S oxidoreductase [Rhodospirillaceae bacterium]
MEQERRLGDHPQVGVFATCLVDLIRPVVGFATVRLLERAGCEVSVPASQTCCGQPAYNSGDNVSAIAIARKVITTFESFDYVVVPSGSCSGTLRKHYPEMFANDPNWAPRAENLSKKTYELTQFLVDVMRISDVSASWRTNVTYHDSCSGLRELGIKSQPRILLQSVEGLTLSEAVEAETCCGFGGLFCVKYGDISDEIVGKKVADIYKTKADMVLGTDLGCLMNIAGKMKRQGSNIEVRHVAEILADLHDHPAIAAPGGTGDA